MKSQTFTIQGELMDLNAFIKALNSHYIVGNRAKQENTDAVSYSAKKAKIKPVETYPVMIAFTWYSPNERKDIDNVAFAKKFVLDGLVRAGVLENDGRKQIRGFEKEIFLIDKNNPRIEITIIENNASNEMA